MKFTYRIIIIFFLIIATFNNLFGQSLPKIQQISFLAPANIKIDGIPIEWGGKYQAFNTADGIWYTIANDDKNLYLITKAPYRDAPDKIMTGGMTFTISHYLERGKRNAATDNISIKFPVLISKLSQGIINCSHGYEYFKNDTVNKKNEIDSLNRMVNNKVNEAFKQINIVGIKDVSEPQISIYNETGIKAMGHFDRQMNFVYELCIPLKLIGLSSGLANKFSYNIKLNARPNDAEPGKKIGINEDAINPGPDYLYRESDSSFWGEYVLAVKP